MLFLLLLFLLLLLLWLKCERKQDQSVGIVGRHQAGQPTVCGSIAGKDKGLTTPPPQKKIQTGSGALMASYCSGSEALSAVAWSWPPIWN